MGSVLSRRYRSHANTDDVASSTHAADCAHQQRIKHLVTRCRTGVGVQGSPRELHALKAPCPSPVRVPSHSAGRVTRAAQPDVGHVRRSIPFCSLSLVR